jgi:hypothetical protein
VPNNRPKFTVLVEELELTRQLWTDFYQEKGWQIETFENPLEFLSQLYRFTNRTEEMQFYFDQDFGHIRGVGVQLARAVEGLNAHQKVSLITLHEPAAFLGELRARLIQGVFEKYPEHIFGENYLSEAIRRNPTAWEKSFVDYGELCALEIAMNTRGRNIDFTLEDHYPACIPSRKTSPEISQNYPKEIRLNATKSPWWRRIFLMDVANA